MISSTNAGRKLPFVVQGNGPRAIVFIHGFLDAGNVWKQVIDSLRQRDHSLVSLDLPGMGDRWDADRELTLAGMAEAVAGVVDALGVPVILVAHSMGTQIAELIARARPGVVKGMVFLSPIPLAGLPVPEQIAEVLRALGKNEPAQREIRRQFSPNIDAAQLELLIDNGMKVKAENVARIFDAWSSGIADCAELTPMDMPVLIVGGKEDPFSTPEVIESSVASRFSSGRTETLSGASHWPHVSMPKEIGAKIDAFLDKLQA